MKISNPLIATAVVALLPFAAIAGDQGKTSAMSGKQTSAQFNTLDVDGDGRISRSEAASDAKIVFVKADKNGDGYLDNTEYMHRDRANDSMPSSSDPSSNPSSNPSTDPQTSPSTNPSPNSSSPNSSSDTQTPRQ